MRCKKVYNDIRRCFGIKDMKKKVFLSLFGLFFAAFVVGGLYLGFLSITQADELSGAEGHGSWQLQLDMPINVVSTTKNPPNWEEKERVNILLLGIDRRPDEAGLPTRTDTMMVLTLDPYSNTAGMLSIPRDLWVPIKLNDGSIMRERINTAHVYGELYNYPGGGPALAKATVQYNFGITVHYYALLDFKGFEKIIDELGGITIDLKKPLIDYEYPTDDYGTKRIYIPAGVQNLDGEKALWYARSRHQDSDIGRMKRQQEVIMAVRDKALRVNVLPKLPKLFTQLSSSIKTDLSISEIIKLAGIGKDIPEENITGASIDLTYATPTITAQGADVMVLKRDAVRQLIQEVFFDPRLREEEATVEVLNNTRTPGLASKAAQYLQGEGIQRVTYGNATNEYSDGETFIIDYSGKSYTCEFIASKLGIPKSKIKKSNDIFDSFDLRVVIGKDVTLPATP